MSRSLRRGALAATATVFSLATLAACGAGNNAQTLQVKPDSAATSIGDITLQNVNLVTQPKAEAGGPAVVTGTLFNNGRGKQTLDAVKLPGTNTTVKLSPAKGSGPISVPALGSVQLGGAGNASAVIENGSEAAMNGNAQQVVFTFSKTGDVGLRALVVPSQSYFKGVGPSALPSPSESASDSASPSDSSSDEPSGSPSGDASGNPSESSSGNPSGSATASASTFG